ncbi:hypothetical protein Pmani_005575 [Petrolisthes manimaculis]|uniref:Ribosome biogenesis protein WDR12 homolog n=1 Tax=Petrolisthes manimaculis TaxID=1843537 RepID=A0AAE1UGJ2_9EUCA|nr:hypothetical protein Pmani_005575 [Petrolisthes manimaculis]
MSEERMEATETTNTTSMEEGENTTQEKKEIKDAEKKEIKEPREKLNRGQMTREDASVLVRFTTKQKQYAVPGASVSVKVRSKPNDLNDIIKAFIQQTGGDEKKLPEFDFVVSGKMLRGGLNQRMDEGGIGYEKVINIEYMKKLPPPTPKDSLQHDDWVAAVQCSKEWLLTGCYDNTVHLWDVAGLARGDGERAHRLTIPAHLAPVKSVTWVDTEGPLKKFISTSIDQTAVVWMWNSEENTVDCVCECRGHTQSVECVAVHSDEMFATGSWDNTINVWPLDNFSKEDPKKEGEGEEKEKEVKKKKGYKSKKMTPLVTLTGHTENVGSAAWVGVHELATASWDHSLRFWDVEFGEIKSQIVGNCAFFSMSYSPLNKTILASCADRYIRLYDHRSQKSEMMLQKFTSHTKWVPSVMWSKTNPHLFVSGGYDCTVKQWDNRSPKIPLYDLMGHEDKVLAVDWSNPEFVISGGADCTAKVFSSNA